MAHLAAALLVLQVQAQSVEMTGTYYGPGYDGRTTACGTTYRADGLTAAVPYGSPWWCGDVLEVEGPAGSVTLTVTDRCPACSVTMIDLSDESNRRVCGTPAHTCSVGVREVQ